MNEPGQIAIRRATSDDLGGLTALFDGYRRFYGNASDIEGARRFLTAPRCERVGCICRGARRRAGRLHAALSFVLLGLHAASLILNDLFVAPAARRSGIGGALMAAAESFARDAGARGLLLATQNSNATAKALYESRGWKLDAEFDHYLHYF